MESTVRLHGRYRAQSVGLHSLDLSAAVDVYGEWVDAAGQYLHLPADFWASSPNYPIDAVAKENRTVEASEARSLQRPERRAGPSRQAYDEEDEGDYEGEGIVPDDAD